MKYITLFFGLIICAFCFGQGTSSSKVTAGNIGSYAWSLTGNSGTDPNTNFIGTTDNVDLLIKRNGYTAIHILEDKGQQVHIQDSLDRKLFSVSSDEFDLTTITGWSEGTQMGTSEQTHSITFIADSSVFVGKIKITDNTQGAGKVLGCDANGLASWTNSPFASADSVTIYALTPTAGTTYFCTDCTGDGITGRIVSYIGAAWRRLKFD